MKDIEVFSEKMGKKVVVSDKASEEDKKVILEDSDSSMAGWSHGGWNNDNGGANW